MYLHPCRSRSVVLTGAKVGRKAVAGEKKAPTYRFGIWEYSKFFGWYTKFGIIGILSYRLDVSKYRVRNSALHALRPCLSGASRKASARASRHAM